MTCEEAMRVNNSLQRLDVSSSGPQPKAVWQRGSVVARGPPRAPRDVGLPKTAQLRRVGGLQRVFVRRPGGLG